MMTIISLRDLKKRYLKNSILDGYFLKNPILKLKQLRNYLKISSVTKPFAILRSLSRVMP
ncbi:hypothetical protein ES705_31764 [subsurface metagenome]